jgi:hypothetical protein
MDTEWSPAARSTAPPLVLFGVHELGIFDHSSALAAQLIAAGARVSFTVSSADPVAVDTSGLRTRVDVRFRGSALVTDAPVFPGDGCVDAALVQTPYDEQRAIPWQHAGANQGLAYAGYGLAISNWVRGHFDLPMYSRCRYLLAPSPAAAAAHLKRGVPPGNVRHTGDALLHELRTRLIDDVDVAPRPTILWMPHWTEDWFGNPGYSTWSETVFDLLEVARAAEATVVVRPHPLLKRILVQSAASAPGRALREFLDLPNVSLSESDLVSDLLRATAALTDGVSVISYAAASGLPVGICRRQDSPLFSPAGTAIVGACDVLLGQDLRRLWIRRHVERIEPRDISSPAADEVNSWFPLHDRSPGELFAEWIVGNRGGTIGI